MIQEKKRCNLLKKKASGYYAERILSELEYLLAIFQVTGDELPKDIKLVVAELEHSFEANGAISRSDAENAEEALRRYSPLAKKYRLICAAHAHIDMNWQWGTDETVGIVIDTFQTMLNLMKEYPQYVFSQSQASTYEIVEKYCPVMLEEIKQRIHEGRWELTASTWVENDKNMSGTESMVRHLLYTKRYLAELFDVDPKTLELDFEPDTFGHTAHLPHILKQGGIKYYYHCRGSQAKRAYRWKAPSGDEVLVNHEPGWYLGAIEFDMAAFVPQWCQENHTDTAMKVYGVGDHGGGPTRRDIERIIDMSGWPLMPKICFGTMHDFFKALERNADKLPAVEKENNFIFTGCYTSQSRIKQGNRMCEEHLMDCEALSSLAILNGGICANPDGFKNGWKRVLFNQFHDILPGSCIREARECALGSYREANGYAIGNANHAMRYLGQLVDTSVYGLQVDPESTAEGAGTGYNTVKASAQERMFAGTTFGVTATENGGGKLRAYTIFNPTQYERLETVELTIWDWPLMMNETAIKDGHGNQIHFDVLTQKKEYWRHQYDMIAFAVRVPAFGYCNYYVMEAEVPEPACLEDQPRLIEICDSDYVLENDHIRAEFEHSTMRLQSLIHKASGKELLSDPATFRLIQEADNPMNSWQVGAYGNITDLNDSSNVKITDYQTGSSKQWLSYEFAFSASTIKVCVSLGRHDHALRFSIEVDFHEIGGRENMIPQLQMYVPYSYEAQGIRYDVPGGTLIRPELAHDVPSIRYAVPIAATGASLYLTTDCKYGYRAYHQTMIIDLLRASTSPDRYPEIGVHQFEIGIGATEDSGWGIMGQYGTTFSHPLYIYSNSLHKGHYGQEHSFLQLNPNMELLALKPGEKGGVVLRAMNMDYAPAELTVSSDAIKSALEIDIHETALKEIEKEDGKIHVHIPGSSMGSLQLIPEVII